MLFKNLIVVAIGAAVSCSALTPPIQSRELSLIEERSLEAREPHAGHQHRPAAPARAAPARGAAKAAAPARAARPGANRARKGAAAGAAGAAAPAKAAPAGARKARKGAAAAAPAAAPAAGAAPAQGAAAKKGGRLGGAAAGAQKRAGAKAQKGRKGRGAAAGGAAAGGAAAGTGAATGAAPAASPVAAPPAARQGPINAALGGNRASAAAIGGNAFCQQFNGLAITNGQPVPAGGCATTIQGALPEAVNMPSTMIVSPANGATIRRGQNIPVVVNTANLVTGFSSNPSTALYTTPQTLSAQGTVQGHQHFVFQKIAGAGAQRPSVPDARTFAFFQGLNSAADANGNLRATIPAASVAAAGPGMYRLCTMAASNSHQPLVMPVAQRGAQDDCVRINVV
ncbi:uncharacterized protein EV422DRAFT_119800 [Fimicolochytrium jonesii]|uniref:uncharacterized protein n=1 Tax=Fimicolochytrium jonesii TaxID=1396493 RepID=UPI0022FE48F3|nr:uncharacterized protein EV422DRAFT_119800 [Fimicolochytrium jonesii]KAI8819158.1 hypothetical protein EV422DRAFT_119800 [Fimicolochytrium jonesii]